MANMMNKRGGHCAVVLDGFVYAFGGFDGDSALDTLERSDVSIDTCAYVAPMRAERADFGACVLNGCVYVFGGGDIDDTSLYSVERYDPASDVWSEVASMSTRRRCARGGQDGNKATCKCREVRFAEE